MNIRKAIDYSAMYTELDALMGQSLSQMELYCEIGRLICSRPEKGAAIMTSEYLQKNYPDVAGFSPRNVRRMREFFRTYGNNEALMTEAMKIGWTQNVLIMERCTDDAERQWYIQAVLCYDWSKLELTAKIDDSDHLKMAIVSQEEVYDTENRETREAINTEQSPKFAAVLPDEFRSPAVEEPHPQPKARGHPFRFRWNIYQNRVAPSNADQVLHSKTCVQQVLYAGFTSVRNYLAGGVTPPFSKSSGNKIQYVNEKAVNYFDHF